MSKTIMWGRHIHRPIQGKMVSDEVERHVRVLWEYVQALSHVGKERNLKQTNAGQKESY